MKSTGGFTFLEFILAMVAGCVIAMVAFVLLTPTDSWIFTKKRRCGMWEAQAAVMRMVKEIRHIKDPSLISSSTVNRLTFTDVDDFTVDFQLSGTDLLRGSDLLADHVQSLAFTYYDEDGNVTAVPADIRIIRAELSIDVEGQTLTARSSERIRNVP